MDVKSVGKKDVSKGTMTGKMKVVMMVVKKVVMTGVMKDVKMVVMMVSTKVV